ncbi:MAG: hypothetical protein M1816_006175 [Peltula sp. TS41687]|nr:MAG: hypothetical protein M1816_006175 [Peltula sp. TS41687]
MAEPQPSLIHEGVDMIEDDVPSFPKSAEDRKAAAALNSVAAGARDDDDDYHSSAAAAQVDTEALGRAMKNLDVKNKDGDNKNDKGGGQGGEEDAAAAAERKKAAVKVDQVDVALLVDELDLSKTKATELLKNYEGDAVRAMKAFVTASA